MEPTFLQEAAKYGPAGLIILALGYVAWSLRGDLLKCLLDRLTETKAALEIISANTAAIAQFTQRDEVRNRTIDSLTRAMELQTLELTRSREELLQSRGAVHELRGEMQKLREILIQRGLPI